MSRETKFRAWDKKNKQMVYGIEETYDGLPYSELNEKVDLDIYNHMSCFSSWLCGDYEVMQYTGLKDKNGVEIYEGDIVTYVSVYKWNKKLQKSVVTFSNGMFNPESVIGWGKDGTREVIGNIYENPELLEASK